MTDDDSPAFATAMAALGIAFHEEVTAERVEIYFRALADLEFVEVQNAVDLAIRGSRFFPRVAELRAHTSAGLLSPAELFEHVVNLLRRHKLSLPSGGFDGFIVQALGGQEALFTMESWLLRKLCEQRGAEWQEVAKVRGLETPRRQIASLSRPALPAPDRRQLSNGGRA